MQRKLRWTHQKMLDYQKFIIKHRNGVIPFLINKKIMNGEEVYFIFDGNNRSNSILDFYFAPLKFHTHLIPTLYPVDVQDVLKTLSVNKLLSNRRYTFDKFCREFQQPLKGWKPADDEMELYEKQWDACMDELSCWNIGQIELPVSVFNNLSDEEMHDIYQSTNSGGTPLNPQELLASSTYMIKFGAGEFPAFPTLAQSIAEYYGDMNINERLHINTAADSINLFEVLLGFQLMLHKTYTFIPEPFAPNERGLDLVFKMFEFMGGSFDVPKRPEDFAPFMNDTRQLLIRLMGSMEYGCKVINRIYGILYDTSIRKMGDMGKYRNVPKNGLVTILSYIYVTPELPTRDHIAILLRVILYHELMKEMDKPQRALFGEDILEYRDGQNTIPDKIRRIREMRGFQHVPTMDEIRTLLTAVYERSIEPSVARTSRKPITRFKALALSAFFNLQIPAHLKNVPQNKDHIVPFSSKPAVATMEYDICRLGNLQLISEDINKRRGTKPITDAWVGEQGLLYQQYPSEAEYNGIMRGGMLENVDAFNAMCSRREALYLDMIMNTLSLPFDIQN